MFSYSHNEQIEKHAFGFYEEDVQLVTTADASIYSHPKVIQLLTSLITASMLCHRLVPLLLITLYR